MVIKNLRGIVELPVLLLGLFHYGIYITMVVVAAGVGIKIILNKISLTDFLLVTLLVQSDITLYVGHGVTVILGHNLGTAAFIIITCQFHGSGKIQRGGGKIDGRAISSVQILNHIKEFLLTAFLPTVMDFPHFVIADGHLGIVHSLF